MNGEAKYTSYYLRNWCLAQELLGNKAPEELAQGIKTMHALPRTLALVPETRKLVLKHAPAMVKTISENKSLSAMERAYAIELICGLDFKIYTEMKGDKQQIELHVNQPLHQLNWLDKDKEEMYKATPFELQAEVKIAGTNLEEIISFNVDGSEELQSRPRNS